MLDNQNPVLRENKMLDNQNPGDRHEEEDLDLFEGNQDLEDHPKEERVLLDDGDLHQLLDNNHNPVPHKNQILDNQNPGRCQRQSIP